MGEVRETRKLTQKIQDLPAEQADQLLLQNLLRHLALLTQRLLLLIAKNKTSPHNHFESQQMMKYIVYANVPFK